MYHFPNHQLYHQNSYQQQCPIFIDHNKQTTVIPGTGTQFEVIQHNLGSIQPELTETLLDTQTPTSGSDKKKKVIVNKSSVDTSTFSIEERLVAAVWVHERKNAKSSMSQIKHDFRQRFGREPPAKNTLLVWERKLFSTGSVHDAPRPGRPVNRLCRMEEVAASVRAAPALSLRARARALRLPRTTLRTILHTDLSHHTTKPRDTHTGTLQARKSVRRRKKLDVQVELGTACRQHVQSGYS